MFYMHGAWTVGRVDIGSPRMRTRCATQYTDSLTHCHTRHNHTRTHKQNTAAILEARFILLIDDPDTSKRISQRNSHQVRFCFLARLTGTTCARFGTFFSAGCRVFAERERVKRFVSASDICVVFVGDVVYGGRTRICIRSVTFGNKCLIFFGGTLERIRTEGGVGDGTIYVAGYFFLFFMVCGCFFPTVYAGCKQLRRGIFLQASCGLE